MFMFQSDLNFKEFLARLPEDGRGKENGEKSTRMKINRLWYSEEMVEEKRRGGENKE